MIAATKNLALQTYEAVSVNTVKDFEFVVLMILTYITVFLSEN